MSGSAERSGAAGHEDPRGTPNSPGQASGEKRRRLHRSRRWPAAVATVVVAVFVVALLLMLGGTAFVGAAGDVQGIVVTRGEFERRVVAEGNLEAVEATQLGAPQTSRGAMRIAWLAPDGSRVREGEVVIRFDPTDMEKELREGEGDRSAAESRIAQKAIREEAALRNLKRDADIAVMDLDHTARFATKDPDVFSRVQIIESEIDKQLATQRKSHADAQRGIREDLSEVELALLEIQKGKAELQIREARTGLSDLEVEAPHDGTFVLREMWGRMPAVGSMVWRGSPVAELPRLGKMQAKVFVLEADAGGLEAGLPATVVLDAHPEREFQATIKNVDALAMKRSQQTPVQYFGVTLEFVTDDPELMKPGQRVRATLMLARQADAIAVPRQAVFEKDGVSVVYVARGGGFDPVEVTLGATGLGRVVVESGIEDGDRVALRDPGLPLLDVFSDSAKASAGPLQATQ